MRSTPFVALLAAASAVQVTGPAAVPATPTAPAATVSTTSDSDKLVCRRELVSGSNIPGKRVCRLKRDIEAEQIAARESAKDMSTPSGGSNSN